MIRPAAARPDTAGADETGSYEAPRVAVRNAGVPSMLVRRRGARMVEIHGGIVAEFAMATTLSHVVRMSDGTAMLEHAEGAVGRREHGYCTDDVARQLLVACLFGEDPAALAMADQALAFVRHAAHENSRFRSRMNYQREWIDAGASDDASGRALWALGVAVREAPWTHIRDGARKVFDRTAGFRSPHWHASAFAVLGASAILEVDPRHEGATALATAAAGSLPRRRRNATWLWPQDRITYAPALLPDALLAVASAMEHQSGRAQNVADGSSSLREDGLLLLRWLADLTTGAGRFSPTPADGYSPGEHRPGFDQQPIEAQAFASAAWRAWTLTSDPEWLELLIATAAWFFGRNDAQHPLADRSTGGCCDGLQRNGVNPNQGAESTLAYLHTMALLRHAILDGSVVLDTRALPVSRSTRWSDRRP